MICRKENAGEDPKGTESNRIAGDDTKFIFLSRSYVSIVIFTCTVAGIIARGTIVFLVPHLH